MLMLQGVPPLGDVKQGWGGETSYFEAAKCVNVSTRSHAVARITDRSASVCRTRQTGRSPYILAGFEGVY